jgi:hypothetical protein
MSWRVKKQKVIFHGFHSDILHVKTLAGARSMVHVIDHLPSKHEPPNSNPRTTKK